MSFWVLLRMVQFKAWYYTHGQVTLFACVNACFSFPALPVATQMAVPLNTRVLHKMSLS